MAVSPYQLRRGLRTITARGGRVTSIEKGRPWLSQLSALTPGAFPTLLPP